MRLIFLGANLGRMVFEDQSRNTFENVRYSKNVLKPKPGECWLPITSAHHMARTVGAFQKVGCDVMPYPVDYRTTRTQTLPGRPDVARRMQEFDLAVHSWLGLLAYYLMDRSSDLLPHATATVCASDARGLWGTFKESAKMEAAAVTRDDDEPGQRRWRILRPPPYSRKSIRMSG